MSVLRQKGMCRSPHKRRTTLRIDLVKLDDTSQGQAATEHPGSNRESKLREANEKLEIRGHHVNTRVRQPIQGGVRT